MPNVETLIKKYYVNLKSKNRKRKPSDIENSLKAELRKYLRDWKKANIPEKKEKKDEQTDQDDEHSLSNRGLKAILWRNNTYNKNCHEYLSENQNRQKYFNMDLNGRKDRLRKSIPEEYVVEVLMENSGFNQRPENFSSTAKLDDSVKYATSSKSGERETSGCAFPYTWNGHHMIPCGAFYLSEKSGGGVRNILTDEQYALLLMSDYDVNRGSNLIPLPDKEPGCQAIHDMLMHPSGHEKYTTMVKEKIKEISKILDELAKESEEPHPLVPEDISEELESIEDELWNNFIKWGREVVDARLGARVPSDEDSSFIKDGKLI